MNQSQEHFDASAQNTGNADINVDPAEIDKFTALASRWWDPEGDFKPLHQLNPVRVGYIGSRVELAGKRILDVGCGGGILTEALAQEGAEVTGIDMANAALEVAKLHLQTTNLEPIRYLQSTAEQTGNDRRRQVRRGNVHGGARTRSRTSQLDSSLRTLSKAWR